MLGEEAKKRSYRDSQRPQLAAADHGGGVEWRGGGWGGSMKVNEWLIRSGGRRAIEARAGGRRADEIIFNPAAAV